MRAIAICLLLIAAMGMPVGAAAQQQLLPVDEAVKQPDFFSFRAGLIAAVARRDAQAILAVVHKDIKTSFGPEGGIDDFKKKWRLDRADSPFWETFATVLALGGTFNSADGFVAPYVFANWPEGSDSFENVAITGSKVRVREAPNAAAATIDALSFVVVPRAQAGVPNQQWVAIRLSNGKTGYVSAAYARSPVDYRAYFQREDGRWKLTLFVAGD